MYFKPIHFSRKMEATAANSFNQKCLISSLKLRKGISRKIWAKIPVKELCRYSDDDSIEIFVTVYVFVCWLRTLKLNTYNSEIAKIL